MMKTTRLLLPFMHGVEMETLEAAVLLAASHHATLVPLSLVPAPDTRGKGARLEHIQQSKDFLEAIQQKASRHRVPLERFEAFTDDVVQSIAVLVQQMACDGAILALRGRNGSLLSAAMIEQLMAMRPCPLFLIYLPSKESSWVSRLREHFFKRRLRYQQGAEKHMQQPPVPGEQPGQEVVLSRYPGSPDLDK
jgi:hypothetical protein